MQHSDDSSLRGGSGRVADYFVVVGANDLELRPLRVDDPLNANDPIKQSRPLEMVSGEELQLTSCLPSFLSVSLIFYY